MCFPMGHRKYWPRDMQLHCCAWCVRGPAWSSPPAPPLTHTESFTFTKMNCCRLISQPASSILSFWMPFPQRITDKLLLNYQDSLTSIDSAPGLPLASQSSLLTPQLLYSVRRGMSRRHHAAPTLSSLSEVHTGSHRPLFPTLSTAPGI